MNTYFLEKLVLYNSSDVIYLKIIIDFNNLRIDTIFFKSLLFYSNKK